MIYSWKFYVIKYIYCGFIDVLLEGVANISAVAVYQPFEQLESLYLESKLITSKNFIGTYFGHMVTISDLGAGPQSRPLPLV